MIVTPTPRLVLFDLMGTLLSPGTSTPYWEDVGAYLEQSGCCSRAPFVTAYAELRRARARALDELTLRERVMLLAQASQEQLDEIESRFLVEYARGTSVMVGAREMLERLHDRATLAVVSNFFVAGAPRELLRGHGLLHYFDFVVDSAEVGVRKPHRGIFECALARAAPDLAPSDVVMIGDDWDADVQGALALGMRAIHFGDAAERGGVAVMRGWSELELG